MNAQRIPNLTASLDATSGLCERILPGWGLSAGTSSDGMSQAMVHDPSARKPPFGMFKADRLDKLMAIALVEAILSALISQKEHENKQAK